MEKNIKRRTTTKPTPHLNRAYELKGLDFECYEKFSVGGDVVVQVKVQTYLFSSNLLLWMEE